MKKLNARLFAGTVGRIDDSSQGRANVGYRLADRTLRWWSVCRRCRSSAL